MVILNETIMGVALPNLMVDLQITAASAQWLTTAYLLTMAIVIPLTGYLLERFPLRRVYMAAMTLFTIGTLIAALAPGFGVLLTGRIVQASGTAVMLPLLFTTVLTLVPPAHRGRMMGVISIVIAVAPAIGPTVSGLILATLDWRWIFWLVLPLALLALVLGAIWVRNVTETDDVRFDVLSVILSAFAFGGLIFGLSSIGEAAAGHAIVPVWIPLVGGTVALIAFILRQLTTSANRFRAAGSANLPVPFVQHLDRSCRDPHGLALRIAHTPSDLPAERARRRHAHRRTHAASRWDPHGRHRPCGRIAL